MSRIYYPQSKLRLEAAISSGDIEQVEMLYAVQFGKLLKYKNHTQIEDVCELLQNAINSDNFEIFKHIFHFCYDHQDIFGNKRDIKVSGIVSDMRVSKISDMVLRSNNRKFIKYAVRDYSVDTAEHLVYCAHNNLWFAFGVIESMIDTSNTHHIKQIFHHMVNCNCLKLVDIIKNYAGYKTLTNEFIASKISASLEFILYYREQGALSNDEILSRIFPLALSRGDTEIVKWVVSLSIPGTLDVKVIIDHHNSYSYFVEYVLKQGMRIEIKHDNDFVFKTNNHFVEYLTCEVGVKILRYFILNGHPLSNDTKNILLTKACYPRFRDAKSLGSFLISIGATNFSKKIETVRSGTTGHRNNKKILAYFDDLIVSKFNKQGLYSLMIESDNLHESLFEGSPVAMFTYKKVLRQRNDYTKNMKNIYSCGLFADMMIKLIY